MKHYITYENLSGAYRFNDLWFSIMKVVKTTYLAIH